MGIEGDSHISSSKELQAKCDKAIVAEAFQLRKFNEVRSRLIKTEPTEEQKIAIDAYLATSDRIENLRSDLIWVKALHNKEYPDENILAGWEEKEIIVAEQKEVESSINSNEDIQDTVESSLKELIATGEPVAEVNARMNELFTLEKATVDAVNNALAEFQNKVPEEVGEEVEQIIYQAMDWKKLSQSKKLMEALIDYPKLSVEDVITIFDKLQGS